MKEIKYVIKDEMGVHARPAGLLVKKLSGYTCTVLVSTPQKKVDGKRLMALMSLGLKQGHEMIVTFDGADEETAYEDVKAFLAENL